MRSIIWLVILAVIVCCPLSAGGAAESQQWEEIFFKANQAYKEGRFNDAIDGYRRLLQSGQRNGQLYYNLGNAYFRIKNLGKATLNYERARLMLPRDADLDFNFRYARDQLVDAVSEPQSYMNMVFFWLNSLNLDELFWGFAILNILFLGGLTTRLFLKHEWTYYGSLLLLIFWLLAGVSFGLKWYQIAADDRAVILKPELNVLAGPDIADTTLFVLHAGTVVHVERSEYGWSLVRLPDKKRGWVKSDVIERIVRRRG